MTQPRQIVYYYDGKQNEPDVEPDLDGVREIPRHGDIINRKQKVWQVVHIIEEREMSGEAIPVFKVFLSSQLKRS